MGVPTIHERARATIVHPALIDAFDAGWYYPWPEAMWPEEDQNHPLVQKAVEEGWSEWIESQADLEAIKAGFVYDQSRDKQGRVVYWYKGGWVRWDDSKRKSRRRTLIKIPIERELEEIAYIGKGDHMCRFAEAFLYHTKAPLEGVPYRFIHWQRKLMLTAFGWIRHTTNVKGKPVRYRRFLKALVEIAKKNAKSDLGSIVSICLIRADDERKAFVYGAASDKKQAGIVFAEARDYVQTSPELKDEIFVNDSRTERKLSHFESGSIYEIVSSDAHRSDGYDAHGVVFDELHQQPNRKLYVIFRRSGQARAQPLEFVTTTYGQTLKSIWGEVHLRGKAVLQERKIQIDQYVMIASAEPIPVLITRGAPKGSTLLQVQRLEQPVDVGEEIEIASSTGGTPVIIKTTQPAKRFQRHLEVEPLSEPISRYSEGTANKEPLDDCRLDHAIMRANPSVGIITTLERIKALILEADGPLAQAEAMRYNLNIVTGGGNLWLSGASWMSCGRRKVLNSSLLKKRCTGGLDLSQTNDLTAFWLAFPNWKTGTKFGKVKSPMLRLLGMVWVPGDSIEKREQVEEIPYRAYAESGNFGPFGYVRICDGETIDYEQVGRDIVKFCTYFKPEVIAYDSYKSNFVVTPYLEPAGLNCLPHRQGDLSMGPASQRFENMVKRHQIQHGNNPMLDWAVEGCVLSTPDKAGNCHPAKNKSLSRIDPLVAAIMAVNWACDPPVEDTGAWSGEEGTGAF